MRSEDGKRCIQSPEEGLRSTAGQGFNKVNILVLFVPPGNVTVGFREGYSPVCSVVAFRTVCC